MQQPHPPLWIGGNSRRSRERVAQTTRTLPLRTTAELRRAIEELKDLVQSAGRDPAAIAVQLDSAHGRWSSVQASFEAHCASLHELEDIGVTSFVVRPPIDTCAQAVDALARYGDEVIAAMHTPAGAREQ